MMWPGGERCKYRACSLSCRYNYAPQLTSKGINWIEAEFRCPRPTRHVGRRTIRKANFFRWVTVAIRISLSFGQTNAWKSEWAHVSTFSGWKSYTSSSKVSATDGIMININAPFHEHTAQFLEIGGLTTNTYGSDIDSPLAQPATDSMMFFKIRMSTRRRDWSRPTVRLLSSNCRQNQSSILNTRLSPVCTQIPSPWLAHPSLDQVIP
jgi:hypothetical protein